MLKTNALARIATRYPSIGPALWVSNIQYFLTQAVVAWAWKHPYSITNNYISDLGNTACGQFAGSYVCSPLYALMNASFIVIGLTITGGAILTYYEFSRDSFTKFGFGIIALSGLGCIVVGALPENRFGNLHLFGAALGIVAINTGIIVLSHLRSISLLMRQYSRYSGVVALIAVALFHFHIYLGIGKGGMERVADYLPTTWLIVFGIYILRQRYETTDRPTR